MIKRYEAAGADAICITPPYLAEYPEKALEEYFAALIESSSLQPIFTTHRRPTICCLRDSYPGWLIHIPMFGATKTVHRASHIWKRRWADSKRI